MSDTANAVVDSDRDEDAYLSPPVQRAVRLLRHIVEGDPVTNLSRTARELGINRTTLLRLLHTLQAERFIEPRPEGQGWRIGVGLIGLAAQAFFRKTWSRPRCRCSRGSPNTLRLSAHLGVLDGLEIVFSSAAPPTIRSPATSGSAAACPPTPPTWAASSSRICRRTRSTGMYAGAVLKRGDRRIPW